MKVIAHPSKTRRNALVLGSLMLAALCSLPLYFVISPHLGGYASLVAVAILLALLRIGAEIAPTARNWMQGYAGERRVLTELQVLPDEYVAVTNYIVPGTKQGDVDLLLIGPMGLLVVEIKTYPGHIVYENSKWQRVQTNGWKTPLKSVSGQVKRNRQAIAAYVKQEQARVPGLRGNIPIQPLLIFVGTDVLETGTLDMSALRVRDALSYVQALPPRLSPEHINALATVFAVKQAGSVMP